MGVKMKEENIQSGDLVKRLREEMQLNRREFCNYFDIPYRTVQDWEAGKRVMPDYVLRLLEYKIRMDQQNTQQKQKVQIKESFGICVMRLSDYEEMYDLWRGCDGIGLHTVDDSKEGLSRFLRRNPDSCFVMRLHDQVVGTILAGNDGRRGYIYHLAVDPLHRQEQIGSRLVNAVLRELKQQGIHKVALVASEDNMEGHAFWTKMGFEMRKELRYYSKDIVE